jgi:DNA modification methylase
MEQYQIKTVRLDALKPHPKNPRTHPDAMLEKLIRSIKEFGFTNPVLIDADNRILAGHARCKAAEKMGLAEVPTIQLALKGDAADAYVIVDNKLTELSGWDADLLTEMMRDLEKNGFDLSLTGFDASETNALFGEGAIENAHEDGFDENKALEQAERHPVTRLGDIWKLGRHKLLCGDSTKSDDVTKLFNGEQADLIVTDPPYNVDYGGCVIDKNPARINKHRITSEIANDHMPAEKFYNFLHDFSRLAYEQLKGGAAFYIFHSSREASTFRKAAEDAKFKVAQTLIWVKNHFTLGRQDYQWIYEPIFYGWKEADGCPHYFINDRTQTTVFEKPCDFKKMGKAELITVFENVFKECQTDILRCDKPQRSDDHPTQKPITLCAKLIDNSSKIGGLVYEPFCGSGSTLIAAEQLKRRCYGIELEPRYCDVTVRRYIESSGDVGVFLVRDGKKIPHKET